MQQVRLLNIFCVSVFSSLYDETTEETDNILQTNTDEDINEEEEHFQDALSLPQKRSFSSLLELSMRNSSSGCEDSSDTDSER